MGFPSATAKWHTEKYASIEPSRPELSAKGKTVVVTGGGTGIGAETAHAFAEAGASRVALLGRRKQPLLDTKTSIERKFPGVEVLVESADASKKDEIEAAFAAFASNRKIDILISNAAIFGPLAAIKEADPEPWLAAIDLNLRGAFTVGQAFLRHAAPNAIAIEVTSGVAHINYAPKGGAYTVSKTAVWRFWDFLAFENPEITVFHVHPGVVATDMNIEASGGVASGNDNPNLAASFMVWTASPEARFLKNKFLWCNWDVDELKEKAKELEGSQQLNFSLVGWPFN